jgi:TIR domain
LVAGGLKSLLEYTFEGIDVFVSNYIEPGEPWAPRLQNELEQSHFGILCLTAENFHAPWLLFEAGAMAKKFESANTRVVPYLIDTLPEASGRSPLSQFQQVHADREGTFLLVKGINAFRENPQVSERLSKVFNGGWSEFEQTLKALPAVTGQQGDLRPDREILETILQKIDVLVQAHGAHAVSRPSLPGEELAHLLNLRYQPTIMYSLQESLKKELRHLRDLGLVRNKHGAIGELPATFEVGKYFELLEPGREYVRQSGTRRQEDN